MLVYPQLGSGALVQFPVQKIIRARTVANALADFSSVKLSDPPALTIEWHISYSGLTDAEIQQLEAFFAASEGQLNPFTFVDPMANLFAWSDRLNETVWSADPFLALAGGVSDPCGGLHAWNLSNNGGGPQSLTQTVNAPGGYIYCLSLYARASKELSLGLMLGNMARQLHISTGWNRLTLTGTGNASAEALTCGITVPSGGSVEVYGLQLEAQPAPSQYMPSTTGGIYEGAYLHDDMLLYTTTELNRHSATVIIIYANHL